MIEPTVVLTTVIVEMMDVSCGNIPICVGSDRNINLASLGGYRKVRYL